jgi:hypothetical protein
MCTALTSGCGLLLDLDPPDLDAGPPPNDAGAHERVCDDGLDDDGDGAIDCADDDCALSNACFDACNGADDDADGRIDENPADPRLDTACYEGPPDVAGVGVCARGVFACVAAAIRCEGWVAPSVELCNGLDDDCDGVVPPDEDGPMCMDGVVAPGSTTLDVEVPVPTLDLHVSLDVTGSMGAVITTLRDSLSGVIVPAVRALFPGAAFGASTYQDFPLGAFGGVGDRPFVPVSRITTDIPSVQSSLSPLFASGGADGPESGIEALHQIATGGGVTWTTSTGITGSVEPVDCGDGFDSARGHGTVGGGCFRAGALPVVVQMTDAQSHDGEDYRGVDPTTTAADATTTMSELRGIGARVVTVCASALARGTPETDPTNPRTVSLATDAVIPACAFDGSAPRLSGACAGSDCCTGLDGAGVPAISGMCPLSYDIPIDGAGLDRVVVGAIEALSRFATFELSVALSDDPSDAVDARCLVQSVEVIVLEPPAGACVVTPTSRDTDGDGLDDTVSNATAATRATFELTFDNVDARDVDVDGDRTEACAPAGSYALDLVVAPLGSAVLATQTVTVVVP